MAGELIDGQLIGLEIDGDDAGERSGGEAFGGKSVFHIVEEFGRGRSALATDADSQALGMINQRPGAAGQGIFGDKQAEAGLRRLRQFIEPWRFPLDANTFTRKQARDEGLEVLGIGQPIAFRFFKVHTEAQFAGRRDGAGTAGELRNSPCQVVCSVVAAQERYGDGAVLRHGDHWRLVPLLGEEGCEDADEDARGAEADDGASIGESTA